MALKLVIPTETIDHERRVAASPETVKKFREAGLDVIVQAGAGEACSISDEAYQVAGASIETDATSLLEAADIVLKVQRPIEHNGMSAEIEALKEGTVFIGLLQPLSNPDMIQKMAECGVTALSMDMVPRIARAQKLDALSSQSNIAGYKAVLIAANHLGKIMPMMMTAAGTVSPAHVLVLGAGVAGLQAIATAKRLGAVVEAFDTRPVVKEQVESLGGKFIELELDREAEDAGGYAKELSEEEHKREQQLVAARAREADVIITTALIPGRPAPVLVPEDVVKGMRPGSVIVDLAAETGGNCELTEPGQTVFKHGVTIVGELNIPSLMALQSSQLYARNVLGLLMELYKDGEIQLDLENQIIAESLITHNGKVVNARMLEIVKGKGVKS